MDTIWNKSRHKLNLTFIPYCDRTFYNYIHNNFTNLVKMKATLKK